MKAQKTAAIALVVLLAGGLMAFSENNKKAATLPKLLAKDYGFVPAGKVVLDRHPCEPRIFHE